MNGELERADIRIATSDREQAVEHLQGCTSEGRLTLDEFTERVDAVYEAKTYGDLRPILSDLPAPDGTTTVAGPDTRDDIAPTGSSMRRKGRWLVPRRITLRPKGSSVLLNFAHAVIGHREVEIDVSGAASSVTLILPRDAWADDNVDARFSSVTNLAQHTGDETGVRFHVRGQITASSIRIRRVRKFLWWEF